MATKAGKRKTKVIAKRPVGRPTDYQPRYCEDLIKFFTVEPYRKEIIALQESETITKTGSSRKSRSEQYKLVPNPLPYFETFAASIGTNANRLLEWCKKYPEFQGAYTHAKFLQQQFIVENGMSGAAPSNFAIFAAKAISGLRDGEEGGNNNFIQIISGDRQKSQITTVPVADRNLLPN